MSKNAQLERDRQTRQAFEHHARFQRAIVWFVESSLPVTSSEALIEMRRVIRAENAQTRYLRQRGAPWKTKNN